MSNTITDFITRWRVSGGSEQANSQMFLAELCDLLEVPRPDPADQINEKNVYSFERKVFLPRGDGTQELKRLDLYRKGCFVLEAKQGKESAVATIPGATTSSAVKRGTRQWEDTMQRAKNQAENYIRCLPAGEGRPPFIIVADIGYCFDLYAEFTCTGGIYLPFPDVKNHRILLKDLEDTAVQDLFRSLWQDPLALDPSRHAARVTEEVASHLAELARLFENSGYSPEKVSQFLMRCIFSMFAEDVGLIPAGAFENILQRALMEPGILGHFLKDLWIAMNDGSVSVALGKKLLRFNGNLFANPEVLPLEQEHIGILLEAAKADWKTVEPAIFGTLLERALNPKERHKLGAHYTPRAYVERLVIPTVMQPLRAEWDAVQTTATMLADQGKDKAAQKTILDFHTRLRGIKVLDPACGSGNFLYVTMEHMKRLEGEVLQALVRFGYLQQLMLEVDPHQFLGLEINPRAAHIAEMVLWIGYLQWHFRTHGNTLPMEPVIKKFNNIQCQDALLTYKTWKYAEDKDGKPITRWNGETYKTDPTTGRQVPDETATTVDMVYEGVEATEWPKADFIVGNPPFVGNKVRRIVLGTGYVDALSKAYAKLPESCDFVMYWWHKAAELVRNKKVQQFGFITTNSITQVFNRRIITQHLEQKPPLYLAFAIPDHPWVDAADGAAVRIAMTVGSKKNTLGLLLTVQSEKETSDRERQIVFAEQQGLIHADLTIGVDLLSVQPLVANAEIASRGVIPLGQGFVITPEEAVQLGLGRIPGLENHIRPYLNGRDIANRPRGVMLIDLHGLSIEQVRNMYPEVYQWVFSRVKPERDHNKETYRRTYWWLFARKNTELREAITDLSRYIVTGQVAKHRFFVFLDGSIIPDDKLIAIATGSSYDFGVLSSKIHCKWALATGGNLGVGNDPVYNKTTCFDPFPFPEATPEQQARIRDLGEKLDAHRKARQELHPDLTMTGMYNVLQALREGRELTAKEKTIHEQGLVTVLRELHDELDAAVAEAYGWPVDLPDEEILARLVALNTERVQEEKNGHVRWLRPEYQTKSKAERKVVQTTLDESTTTPATKSKKVSATKTAVAKQPWPSDMLEQTQAVRSVVASLALPNSPKLVDAVAKAFTGARKARIQEIITALTTLGFIAISEQENNI